jgi:hypothetical protein
MKLLIMQFSSTSCHFILLGSNILLRTFFKNTLSLRSFLNVRDQISRPYRTTGKVIVLYILIFTFLDSRRELLSYNMIDLGKRRFGGAYRWYLQGLQEKFKPGSACRIHVVSFLIRLPLKTEELLCSSETSVCLQTTRRCNPEYRTPHIFPQCNGRNHFNLRPFHLACLV